MFGIDIPNRLFWTIMIVSGLLFVFFTCNFLRIAVKKTQSDNIFQLSAGEIRQIEFLGQPQVKPFEPDKKFVVVEREVVENVFLAELPLVTVLVKRTGDNSIFRAIAKNYSRDPSMGLRPKDEVKLYELSWDMNMLGQDGFLYAVHPWEVHGSHPLTKNPK